MAPKNKNNFPIRVFVVLISVFSTFITLEIIARIHYSENLFYLKDYRGTLANLYKSALPARFDEILGWIPQPGYSGTDNLWGTDVTILTDGIRANGNNLNLESPKPILIVGDSFIFGEEVSDTDTWPSHLERLLNRPVLNAGVFGYGTDQIFLRLQSLLEKYQPETIIFGFIPEDIIRSEYSTYFGSNKPYFAINDNALKLMNVPVRQLSRQPKIIIHILGHSCLFHNLLQRLNLRWWLLGGYDWNENQTGHRGEDITCLIFRNLETLAAKHNIRHVFILVQDTRVTHAALPDARVNHALGCINKEKVNVIDLRKALLDIKTKDESLYNSLFIETHMSASGNRFVAETVFQHMYNVNH